VSKREERERRKAEKVKAFEASKNALVARVAESRQPKIASDFDTLRAPKLAPHLERAIAVAAKNPKAVEQGSRYKAAMTWCISNADRADLWSWGEPRDWANEEWDRDIHPPMSELARLTWQEIDGHSSESGHKMHHGHDVTDLIAEAQSRWSDLNLEQYDSVFRFRLGATKRAWGYVIQAHFFMVWWDRKHSIYPTSN
jgi:hypothetical protein